MQSGAAILDEIAGLAILWLERCRVHRRVEGFSLPPLDHGCFILAIGVWEAGSNRALEVAPEATRLRLLEPTSLQSSGQGRDPQGPACVSRFPG